MTLKKLLKIAIKDGYRFKAVDKSGQVFLYRNEPSIDKEVGMWTSCEPCLFFKSLDSGKGWKTSLGKIA